MWLNGIRWFHNNQINTWWTNLEMFINNYVNNSQCVLVFSDVQHTRAVEEKSVFVRVGDAGTLPCLFNRSLWGEGAQMGWERDMRNSFRVNDLYRNFPNEGNTRIMFNNNMNITGHGVTEGDFSLLISPVRFDDYGTFTCYHNNLSTHKQTTLTTVNLVTAEGEYLSWCSLINIII